MEAQARREGRVLVTCDLDFAEIRRYRGSAGVIVLRMNDLRIGHCIDVMRRVLATLGEDDIRRRLIIVEDARIRVRDPEGES